MLRGRQGYIAVSASVIRHEEELKGGLSRTVVVILVADAGMFLLFILRQHLGLRGLVNNHVDLGEASRRAHAGDKMLTLDATTLTGIDSIYDTDAVRADGTAAALSCVVKAPSTSGTFLRSFRWRATSVNWIDTNS